MPEKTLQFLPHEQYYLQYLANYMNEIQNNAEIEAQATKCERFQTKCFQLQEAIEKQLQQNAATAADNETVTEEPLNRKRRFTEGLLTLGAGGVH